MFIALLIVGFIFRQYEVGVELGSDYDLIMLIAMLVYIFAFGISLGPIPYVICAEIFPLEVRDLGLSITTLAHWIATIVVVQNALTIIHEWGGSTLFFIFAAFCLLGLILIKCYMPETKGISLEAIEMNLKDGKKLKNLGNKTAS